MAETFVLKNGCNHPLYWGEGNGWVSSANQAKFMTESHAYELMDLAASFNKVTTVVNLHMTKKRLGELKEARKFMNAIDWDFTDDDE